MGNYNTKLQTAALKANFKKPTKKLFICLEKAHEKFFSKIKLVYNGFFIIIWLKKTFSSFWKKKRKIRELHWNDVSRRPKLGHILMRATRESRHLKKKNFFYFPWNQFSFFNFPFFFIIVVPVHFYSKFSWVSRCLKSL